MLFDVQHVIYWGVLVFSYYFLKGIASGVFFWVSYGEITENPKIQRVSRIGIWLTFAFTYVLPLILIADLAQPGRFWELFFRFRPLSPMAWGALILTIYLIAGAITTSLFFRKDFVERAEKAKDRFPFLSLMYKVFALGRMELTEESLAFDKKMLRRLFMIDIGIAVALELYGGILISVNASRPLWNTPVLPFVFFTSALASGAAMLLIVYSVFTYSNGKSEEDMETLQYFRRWIFWLLVAELVFFMIRILYFLNSTGRAKLQFIFLFDHGFETVEYIVVDLGIAILVPMVLLGIPQIYRHRTGLIAGGLFTILGAGIYKYNLIVGGQVLTRTSVYLAELDIGSHEIWTVVSVILGLITLSLFVYWYLPWQPSKPIEKEVSAK